MQKKTKDNLNVTTQTETAEKYLRRLLDKICQAVDIRLSEWDVDKDLFVAVLNSPKQKLLKSYQACADYSECYMLLKELNIKIPAKYHWFANILDYIQ